MTPWRGLLLLALPNALFSAAMVQHSASLLVALVYLVCSPLALLAALAVVRLAGRPPLSVGVAALVGVLLVAAAVFALVYPIADGRKAVGAGTDADDALDLGARALLRGEYPYLQRTYLNNPITPLPGWLALATPFVVVFGRAAYLNVFWLAVWLVVLLVQTRSAWLSAVMASVTLVVFPGVAITYVNGSDSFASVVAVCGLLVLADRRARWLPLAVATGVVLSSRFNVVLLLPVLVGVVARRGGLRQAMVYGAVASLVWLGVSFWPWLVDAADFSPLHTYGFLGRYDVLMPGFGFLVPVLTGLLAVWLGWRISRGRIDPWLSAAVVLTLPVACAFIGELALTRHLDLWPLVYGLMATPLWVGAVAPTLAEWLSGRLATGRALSRAQAVLQVGVVGREG